jgi:hypothetical protein
LPNSLSRRLKDDPEVDDQAKVIATCPKNRPRRGFAISPDEARVLAMGVRIQARDSTPWTRLDPQRIQVPLELAALLLAGPEMARVSQAIATPSRILRRARNIGTLRAAQ